MSKDEYLSELKINIMSLTVEEQNDALQYYSDYFDEAGDDEKVIKELGSPAELAETIKEKFANALVDTKKKSSSSSESSCDSESDSSSGSSAKKAADGVDFDALYYEFDKKKIRNLTMRFETADVVLIPGSGNLFCVETRGILENDLNCFLDSEGSLVINNNKHLNFNFWGHERRTRFVPRILISVPENTKIEKLKINVGAGNFRAKGISLEYEKGDINVGAGNIVLDSLYGGSVNLKCGMGNLDYFGEITGRSDIDCGMGNVRLQLSGKPEDYSYDAKVGLGNFKFNNEKKSGVCQILNNQKKNNHFSVNCGMGNVSIKF